MTRRPASRRARRRRPAVRRLFDTISPRYDLVNRVMTFGMDVGWRRRDGRASSGSRRRSLVFDLACGTGDLCRELARAGHRPVGFDFSFGMLANARTVGAARAGRRAAPPGARWRAPTASRAASRCATSCRSTRCSRSSIASCDRAAGSRCWTRARPTTAAPRRPRRVLRQVVPVIGGLLSDGEAYAYLPRSMAYLPVSRPTCCGCCAWPGSPTPGGCSSPAGSRSCRGHAVVSAPATLAPAFDLLAAYGSRAASSWSGPAWASRPAPPVAGSRWATCGPALRAARQRRRRRGRAAVRGRGRAAGSADRIVRRTSPGETRLDR